MKIGNLRIRFVKQYESWEVAVLGEKPHFHMCIGLFKSLYRCIKFYLKIWWKKGRKYNGRPQKQ